jgi:hypothetical protein
MQDIKIKFLSGPLKGHATEVEVGDVLIGRQPGERGLELKGADTTVSRIHAQLIEQRGEIVVRNKSPNGTIINGRLTLDESVIKSGAKLGIGDQFELQLEWKTFGADTVIRKPKSTSPDGLKKGPLSSPVLRAVLAVYLGGILLVGLWVALSPGEGIAGDDWPALAAAYQGYKGEGVSAEEWEAREMRAEELVRELRALRTRDMESEVSEMICRELMSIDGDIRSPLYQYGARCLADR